MKYIIIKIIQIYVFFEQCAAVYSEIRWKLHRNYMETTYIIYVGSKESVKLFGQKGQQDFA